MDLRRAMTHSGWGLLTAADVMNSRPPVVYEDTPVADAEREAARRGAQAVVVLDRDARVAGVLEIRGS
jgi:CBS domain-containing protein